MGILLFNLAGYRLLNGLLQDRAGAQLQSRVDRHQYDLSQLISVKFPVTHLSYYNNSPSFERMDGQIEINGVGSEATHIWDPDTTLPEAYAAQFMHYRAAFEIGAANRARGFRPTPLFKLLGLWRQQKRLMASYPAND